MLYNFYNERERRSYCIQGNIDELSGTLIDAIDAVDPSISKDKIVKIAALIALEYACSILDDEELDGCVERIFEERGHIFT